MSQQRLFEAIEFAARAHRGQFRKKTRVPYILHPLNVARLLIEAGCEEDVVVAGLLHDTVEDANVSLKQIHEMFGGRVAELVEATTEPDKSQSWEKRKQHTIESMKSAPIEVLFVLCADKIDNLRTMRADIVRMGASDVWSRFKRGKEQQEWYFRGLASVVCSRASEGASSIFREFTREVDGLFGVESGGSPPKVI